MSALGERSPLPLQLGGGPSDCERVHAALRDLVGTGSAGPDGGIDDAWRLARAKGLAAVAAFSERAILQAWPDTATDHIPVYEELLGVLPPIGASEEERRQVVTELWTKEIDATMPALLEQLQALDTRLSVLNYDHDQTGVTHLGRAYEPFVPTDANPVFGGGRHGTAYPNYSDEFVYVVFFDLGAGVAPDHNELATIATVRALLCEVLPSWISFRIITEVGFILDSSLLDIAALGS